MSTTHHVSRRTLAKGAAWATPIVAATATIPAYAASANRDYVFTGAWFTDYSLQATANCYGNYGTLRSVDFTLNFTNGGKSTPGFGVYERNGSPTTNITATGIKFEVAYPAGFVTNLRVDSGSYTVSGPVRVAGTTLASDAAFNQYDVWTFTFTGTTTNQTADTVAGPSWPGSVLETTATFDTSICVPREQVYYARFQGSLVSDNGWSFTIPQGWIPTTMTAY